MASPVPSPQNQSRRPAVSRARPSLRIVIAALIGLLFASPAFAQGPGMVQSTFTPAELEVPFFQAPVATVGVDPTLAEFQHGYLIIAGQGLDTPNGGGGVSWWDVSNPRTPVLVEKKTFRSHKPHALGFWGNYCFFDRVFDGPEIWDVVNRQKVSSVPDTEQRSLTVFVQAPYVYKGSSGYSALVNRISIWDFSDVNNPVLANEIDTSFLGFKPDSINVVGNLLLCASGLSTGAAAFDISDPLNPVLLSRSNPLDGRTAYQAQIYGDKFYVAREFGGVMVYDFSDPQNLTMIGQAPVPGQTRYLAIKDGVGYAPVPFHGFAKFDPSSLALLSDNLSIDMDAVAPIGNMLYLGGDSRNAVLMPYDTQPDTTGPSVLYGNPLESSTNIAPTARIGFSMSDHIDVTSLTSANFTVRPLGGASLPGTYSTQMGLINFTPDQPLLPDTTYEVVLPAGGIRDLVGNGLESSHQLLFSTGATVLQPPVIDVIASSSQSVAVDAALFFALSATDPEGGDLEYSWDFGDGTQSAWSTSAAAIHYYSAPGRYTIIGRVRATASDLIANAKLVRLVHYPFTNPRAVASGQIVYDAGRDKVWNVNPDNDTVTRIDTLALGTDFEIPVGAGPRSIALSTDGAAIWVACERSDSIHVLDAGTGALIEILDLDYGSGPAGIVPAPDGNAIYVSCMGKGLLLEFDPLTRNLLNTLSLGPTPRDIAVTGDSSRIFVGRHISPESEGQVWEVSASTFSLIQTVPLVQDPGPDTDSAGRGVPNYLLKMAISPDGRELWVPAKKDNTARGLFRDGQPLLQDATVRSVISQIDLTSGAAEDLASRADIDNHGLANGIVFSPTGDIVFVAYQDNNEIIAFDTRSMDSVAGYALPSGLSPQGLVLSPDGTRLYVHNFMSRTIRVLDVDDVVMGTGSTILSLGSVSAVASEKLSPEVLTGKQVFYNGGDRRMNFEGYISCATCHLDGGHDGRVWDFTDRGEGLRNTATLRGKRGTMHGPVHWTGNFDEIHDFENDIRGAFGGTGFMSNADFDGGTHSDPLGDRKSGLSPELDALAAYLRSLDSPPRSPHREPDGLMSASALAGRALFQALACNSCHSGEAFTDSGTGALHDVGTLKPSSGNRIGGPLTGIDTPTLSGIAATAPYLHDGSAASLADVFTPANAPAATPHAGFRTLNPSEQAELLDYLLQLDNSTDLVTIGVLPAETAVLLGDASIESTHSGYNDTGYVSMPLTGGGIQWNSVDGVDGGPALLKFRYAMDESAEGPIMDLSTGVFSSYSNQDISGTFAVIGGGTGVTLDGNTWKKMDFPYTITANTVLQFDVTSTNTGEIIGIGFDKDDVVDNFNGVYALAGTQAAAFGGFLGLPVDPPFDGVGTQTFTFDVGEDYAGAVTHLVFACDDDASSAANVTFSNIRIYENAQIRRAELRVNGVARKLPFTQTGGLDQWAYVETEVRLDPGAANVIEVESIGSDAGNLDELEVCMLRPPVPPAVPGGLAADSTQSGIIDLTWDPGGGDAETFTIEYAPADDVPSGFIQVAHLPHPAAAFSVTGLIDGVEYVFRIRASNQHGDSAWSALLNFTLPSFPQNYYVSPAGDDANDGLSHGSPWRTLAKVNQNSAGFAPGTAVFFQRGGEWREQLEPGSSGTLEDPIIYDTYHTDPANALDPKPKFWGSDILPNGGFAPLSGTTYTHPVASEVHSVFADHVFLRSAWILNGRSGTDTEIIDRVKTTPDTWAWIAGTLYVNPGGPDPRTDGREWTATLRDDLVRILEQDFVHVHNIVVDESARDDAGYGFRVERSDNILLEDCEAYRAGKHHFGAINSDEFVGRGLYAGGSALPNLGFGGATYLVSFSDGTRTGDSSHWIDCTVENDTWGYLGFFTHGTGIDDVHIENCTFLGAEIQTGFEFNDTIRMTGGLVKGFDNVDRKAVITTNGGSCTFEKVTFEGHAFLNLKGAGSHLIQNCCFNEIDAPSHLGAVAVNSPNCIVRFNTIAVLQSAGVPVYSVHPFAYGSEIYANLFDATNAGVAAAIWAFAPLPAVNIHHNFYHQPAPATFYILEGNSFVDFAAWKSSGYDADTTVGDAMFTDPGNGDFSLQPASDAIDAIAASLVPSPPLTDFRDKPRPTAMAYDPGAFETCFPGLSIHPVTGARILTWELEAGKNYHVERSTNLLEWINVGPAVNCSGPIYFFIDASGSPPRAYYRACETAP